MSERRFGPDPPARIEAAFPISSRGPLIASETVVETEISADGLGSAAYDHTHRYRYHLSRVWEPTLPRCCFVMLNPSTADALRLDPTIRRCVAYARAWGCGALDVVNVFALRATDPAQLRRVADPVGPENDEALLAAARPADLVIAAWGTAASLGGRAEAVRQLLTAAGIELSVLRLTKSGAPGHPLYLPSDARPVIWSASTR